MKIDHLMHFLETARQQHLTKAAGLLRISPSAVSYSIQCLEEELGVSLFEKRGKRIFLTDAGKRLLKKIPDVQRSLSDLRVHVTADAPAYQGHYRVGASHVLAETVLAPAAASLFGAQHSVSIDVFSLRSAEVISRILDEQLEAGLCFSPQEHPRIESKVVYQGLLKVYARKGHPLLKSKSPLKALEKFPSVMPKAFGGIDVCDQHPVFKAHGLVPAPRFAFDDYAVGVELLRSSDAWGFFADWVERTPGFALKALPLPKTWNAPYTVNTVHLKNRFLDPGLEHLLQALAASMGRHA